MAVKYLLDTNIVSEPVRKSPDPGVVRHIQATGGAIAIAATTWHELLFGVLRLPVSPKRAALEQYLSNTIRAEIPILAYDAKAATWFAQERARLSGSGLSPSYPDGHVAAVAVTNDLILVTRNVADFVDFSELKVENWFES
jgi:tRNA(fMet)-specific endonuclease VapC